MSKCSSFVCRSISLHQILGPNFNSQHSDLSVFSYSELKLSVLHTTSRITCFSLKIQPMQQRGFYCVVKECEYFSSTNALCHRVYLCSLSLTLFFFFCYILRIICHNKFKYNSINFYKQIKQYQHLSISPLIELFIKRYQTDFIMNRKINNLTLTVNDSQTILYVCMTCVYFKASPD